MVASLGQRSERSWAALQREFIGKLRGELPEPANVDWGGIQACAPFALDHLTSSALASLDLRADHDAPDYS